MLPEAAPMFASGTSGAAAAGRSGLGQRLHGAAPPAGPEPASGSGCAGQSRERSRPSGEGSQVRRAERRGEAPALGGRTETAAPPAGPGAASSRCRPALPRGCRLPRRGGDSRGRVAGGRYEEGRRGPEAAAREPSAAAAAGRQVRVSAQRHRRAEGAAPPPARPRPWGTRCSARGRRCATR